MAARLPLIPIGIGIFALLYFAEILLEAATR